MSYNLLLDTSFNKIDKHWKLTNCVYQNGYLISSKNLFAIEQEIILPNPTKLYFSLDYMCFDPNIKNIYCGIQINDILEVNTKIPRMHKRTRIGVVDNSKQAKKVIVKFIVESESQDSKIYIDSPLLLDLTYHNKDWWPRWMLNKLVQYRCGYNYENLYERGKNLSISNTDFSSVCTPTEDIPEKGILAKVKQNDWFRLSYSFTEGKYYLIKLDCETLNDYGQIYMTYGDIVSTRKSDTQIYIIFKANTKDNFKIILENSEPLPFMVLLKHILVVDLATTRFEEDDILHLPFI